MHGHAYLRSTEKIMLANVEIMKGDVGRTVEVCVLGRVMNRLAQTQEILPKVIRAFISINYCSRNLVNRHSDHSVIAIRCHLHHAPNVSPLSTRKALTSK